MALTGVIQRRDSKAIIVQNPPRVGEVVFALDTEEYGSLMNGTLVWKKFDDIVKSVAGRTGAITLSKFDVQLDNVDNTSDIDKPITTATQLAMDNHNSTINAHGVTTTLLGLENVDNTNDMDKPVSTATQIAIDAGVGTISEVNNALNLGGVPANEYALVSEYFTKLETQDLLNLKADTGVSYTKLENDVLLNNKADQGDLTLTDQKVQTLEISNSGKADLSYVDQQNELLDTAKADKTEVSDLEVIVTSNTDDTIVNRTDINTNTSDISLLQIQKADKSYVDETDESLQTQITTNHNDIANLNAGGVTKSYVDDGTDTINTRIDTVSATKADITYVDSQDLTLQGLINNLSTEKASTTYVDNAIANSGGVSQSYVDTKVDYLTDNKADITYVDTQDSTLQTNINDVNDVLQANITDLETYKASIIYVDSQDNLLDDKIDANTLAITDLTNSGASTLYVDTADNSLQQSIDLLNINKSDKDYVDTNVNDLTILIDDVDALKADITYVDSLITGLDAKESVRVSTTENITLSGLLDIDEVTLLENDRVLVKNQTDLTQNGLYTVSTNAWIRSEDADNNPGSEVNNGMYCFVNEGLTNNDTGWILSATDPVTLGTSELTFNKFSNIVINASDILDKLKTVDGSGSGLDADLLDGHNSSYFAPQSDTYTKFEVDDRVADATMSDDGILDAVKRVDGSGSGIDADLLDGYDSTVFVRPGVPVVLDHILMSNNFGLRGTDSSGNLHIISRLKTDNEIEMCSTTLNTNAKGTWNFDNKITGSIDTALNANNLDGHNSSYFERSINYVTITDNFTVNAFNFVFADTSNNEISITLPSTPNNHDIVKIHDVKSTFDTNNLTVVRNSKTIMGLEEDMIINQKNATVNLIYTNNDWRII